MTSQHFCRHFLRIFARNCFPSRARRNSFKLRSLPNFRTRRIRDRVCEMKNKSRPRSLLRRWSERKLLRTQQEHSEPVESDRMSNNAKATLGVDSGTQRSFLCSKKGQRSRPRSDASSCSSCGTPSPIPSSTSTPRPYQGTSL